MDNPFQIDLLDSTKSEAYIIGAVLNDGTLFLDMCTRVHSEMFSNPIYAELWENMSFLVARNEPVSISTVPAAFPDLVRKIGIEHLTEIYQSYTSKSETKWHVAKLTEMYFRRRMVKAAREIHDRAWDVDETTLDQLRTSFEEATLSLSDSSSDSGLTSSIEDVVMWMEEIERKFKDEKRAYGMQTRWTDLDSLTLGWQRKDLIVVGARTSVGKTAFAIENLIRLRKQGYKVGMFSLEMDKDQVRNRIAANMAGIRLSALRTGRFNDKDELLTVSDTMSFIAQIPIDDARGVTAEYIITEMMRRKRSDGLDFVVVDYLQEIQEQHQKNDNAGSAGGRVARKLRKAAKECDCAVMALSQLSRDSDGGKPKLKHLSGSAGIESAADVVLLLHRDKDESPKMLSVNVAKQRNGATGELNLYYDNQRQRIAGIREGDEGI